VTWRPHVGWLIWRARVTWRPRVEWLLTWRAQWLIVGRLEDGCMVAVEMVVGMHGSKVMMVGRTIVLFLPCPPNRVRNCLCKVQSSNYRRVQSTRRSTLQCPTDSIRNPQE
jgi:hypothetical protein